MNADRSIEIMVEAWLADGFPAQPDVERMLGTVRAGVAKTPRRHDRRWPFARVAGAPVPESGPWPVRGSTMFSAVKFVVAAAIVALFGGFLLAGVLTTPPDDEMAPAAVTESPSPMTSEQLLSGMVTEEVEPGVYRVVNDGVRALTRPSEDMGGLRVDVTSVGSVWLSGIGDGQGLFRLGEERVFEGRTGEPPFREVAPDGSLWITDGRSIFSFDGEGWTVRATTTDRLWVLAVGPDGTVWAAGTDTSKHCPDIEDDDCSLTAPKRLEDTVLLRLEDDGSLTTIEDWADVHDGVAWPSTLAVSPDGDVWLTGEGGETKDGTESATALLRFDGEGWEAIPSPGEWAPDGMGSLLDIGPDGTLWVGASGDVGEESPFALARYDGAGWTTFTDADGVEPWGDTAWAWAYMDLPTVAADGSLWLQGIDDHRCDGAAHYDGRTWTSYLEEYCINDLAIAPDGSVWLGASAYDYDTDIVEPADLYVITPEAVAATE